MMLKNETVVKTADSKLSKNLCLNSVFQDRKKAKFFTGLFPEQFEALFTFLGPAKYELNYWSCTTSKASSNTGSNESGIDSEFKMHVSGSKPAPARQFTVKEEFYITLLRLRRGFSQQTLAYLFAVSESLISNMFITWI